jgi:hypothetical protein
MTASRRMDLEVETMAIYLFNVAADRRVAAVRLNKSQ